MASSKAHQWRFLLKASLHTSRCWASWWVACWLPLWSVLPWRKLSWDRPNLSSGGVSQDQATGPLQRGHRKESEWSDEDRDEIGSVAAVLDQVSKCCSQNRSIEHVPLPSHWSLSLFPHNVLSPTLLCVHNVFCLSLFCVFQVFWSRQIHPFLRSLKCGLDLDTRNKWRGPPFAFHSFPQSSRSFRELAEALAFFFAFCSFSYAFFFGESFRLLPSFGHFAKYGEEKADRCGRGLETVSEHSLLITYYKKEW